MRRSIAIMLGILVLPALAFAQEALTVEKLDAAKRAVEEKEKSKVIAQVDDTSIEGMRCQIIINQASPLYNSTAPSPDVEIDKSDPVFSTMLTALKQVGSRLAVQADESLAATGIEAKAIEAAPVEPKKK